LKSYDDSTPPEPKPETDQLRQKLPPSAVCLLPTAYAFPHSSANKVHDLYSIIFRENNFGPLITPDYLMVKLDRNSRRRQRQFID
jgi:hypothetical protein